MKIPHDYHLWGTPGPHCQGPVHGVLPLLEDQLPLDSDDDDKKPFAEALSPLASASSVVGAKENPKLMKGATLGLRTEAQSILEQLEKLELEEKQLMELAQLRKILAEKQEALVQLRNKSASIQVPPFGATTTQTETENTIGSSRPRANQEARGVHEDLLSMKSMTAKDLRKLELAGREREIFA